MGSNPGLAQRARELTHRIDARRVPGELQARWVDVDVADPGWRNRLRRDRVEIVPWLHRTRSLVDATVVEIGCGEAASTLALAEQGATVVGIDVDGAALDRAQGVLRSCGFTVRLECANAAELHDIDIEHADWVIFWASLEHMLHDERIAALAQAWALLPTGGLLTVIETPNRLWPFDSHTSVLPYFSWLPDRLAFTVASRSTRPGFGGDHYRDPESQMIDFLRRGRGVSFHEFDVAVGDHRELKVASCMQLDVRARNPLRRIGWHASTDGRAERVLRSFSPASHRAWFQPFLYLTLEK